MDVLHISAFSRGDTGGNPAGVVLLDAPAEREDMARVAADVGYSETAFASPADNGAWRVRYFAPESEVPFCGHATIALGAALGEAFGAGTYQLVLNDAEISVEVEASPTGMVATLISPRTRSRAATVKERSDALALFGLTEADLDDRLPPARIHGGADHLLIAISERTRLKAMSYDLDKGREMMRQHELVTVMLVYINEEQTFSARNAFASGGVLEDPATGAAAAAFAGYLRDMGWPHGGSFTIRQGEDMGAPSLLSVTLTNAPGAPVRVSGRTRKIQS